MNNPDKKILFVDDEKFVIESLQLVFRDWHFDFTTSPLEAIEMVKKTKYSVIVSDQRMPGLSGTELLKQVKELSPTTVRIILTGYSELDLVIDSINSGEVWRFINKPWDNQKLKETVQAAYDLFEVNRLLKEEVEKTKTKSAASSPAPTSLINVLFIDKVKEHLGGYEALLKSSVTFYGATTLDEASQILKNTQIGIVACDSDMSAERGADFLTYVRNYYPQTIRIYISDSKDAGEAIRLINESQIFRYLIKPFPKQALIEILELAATKYRENVLFNGGEKKSDPVAFSKMLSDIQGFRGNS